MDVSDPMNSSPITTDSQRPVLEARHLKIAKRIRHLLVMDGPELVGLLQSYGRSEPDRIRRPSSS